METRPDPGVELRRRVLRRLDPTASEFATSTMRRVVSELPTGAASTRVFVTVTWSRSRFGTKGRRGVDEVVLEIAQRLPELCDTLGLTGAGPASPMNEARLAATIRGAYDPMSIAAIEDAGGEEVEWANAGPVTAQATPGTYLHDGATSISWVMGEAPPGIVRSSVLQQLLRPSSDVQMKRVTMLYRPITPARAAQIVDQDRRIAEFQARQRRVSRTRDFLAIRVAERTADEEARGAGLVRFGMIVTATTWGPEGRSDREVMDRAVNVVEQLGGGARIRLRRAWRSQETTFLAGLPLGLVLPHHLEVPREWRD